MVKSTATMINMHDGVLLNVLRFEPSLPLKGVIQMVHGFGEHVGQYEDLALFFTQRGYVFVIHDQRGFGEMSDKSRRAWRASQGRTPGYIYFVEDVKTVRNNIGSWYPEVPVFLFGLSMGGNIAINVLLRYPQDLYEKVILESPWLRLERKLSPMAIALIRMTGKISGKLVASTNLNFDGITRNTQEVERIKNDKIFHD
jgi:lysophospholipase